MNTDSIYTIESREQGGGQSVYRLRLDASHPVYLTHFPGEPVTPGACIVRMAVLLTGDAVGETLQLQTLHNAKFLSVLSPVQTPVAECVISKVKREGDEVSATVDLRSEHEAIARLSITCTVTKE